MIDWMFEIFFSEKNESIIVFNLCSFSLVNEVRGDVATVEFHALNDVHLIPQGFSILYSNDSFSTDLAHSFTNQISDRSVTIGRDSSNLSNFHRGSSMGNIVHPPLCNCSGKNSSCGGTVSSLLVSLVSNILDKFCSDVLELILQFDSFGHCDTVFSDFWTTPGRFNNNVPAFGTHSHRNGVCQNIHS